MCRLLATRRDSGPRGASCRVPGTGWLCGRPRRVHRGGSHACIAVPCVWEPTPMTPGFQKPEGAHVNAAVRPRVITVSCSVASVSADVAGVAGAMPPQPGRGDHRQHVGDRATLLNYGNGNYEATRLTAGSTASGHVPVSSARTSRIHRG